jgi:hypothetical protein
MKDAFERRALLLHLGTLLEAISTLLAQAASISASASASHQATVHALVARHRPLAKHALLQQMPAALTVSEFAQRASAAFASWPRALLEADLDRAHLARTVRDALFNANEAGWRAYVESLKAEVSWFGEGLPPMPAQPAADEAPSHRSSGTSTERRETAAHQPAAQAEAAMEGAGLYPAWPWKPQA